MTHISRLRRADHR